MLAVIGGTGIYQMEGLSAVKDHQVSTPFGSPSAAITEAAIDNRSIFFLPRHGSAHQFLPHEINYRANIYALKQLGATRIIGISAMGSLREDIKPGDLAIPNQYFDFVKGSREKTYFGNGIAAHVSTAEPSCHWLTEQLVVQPSAQNVTIHTGKTYACVDGPRLGTKAESHFLRQIGCDLVGMTNVPEAFLAREAQICYATLGVITDFDCWMDDPKHHVSVAEVIARYGQSLVKAKEVLLDVLTNQTEKASNCRCRQALSSALLTPMDAIPEDRRDMLNVLLK